MIDTWVCPYTLKVGKEDFKHKKMYLFLVPLFSTLWSLEIIYASEKPGKIWWLTIQALSEYKSIESNKTEKKFLPPTYGLDAYRVIQGPNKSKPAGDYAVTRSSTYAIRSDRKEKSLWFPSNSSAQSVKQFVSHLIFLVLWFCTRVECSVQCTCTVLSLIIWWLI